MTLDEYIKLYYKPDKKFERKKTESLAAKVVEGICSKSVLTGFCHTFKLPTIKLPTFEKESPFSDYFFEILKEKGVDSPEVYKKCCMKKQTFSRIMNPKNHPSKHSVLALCIGLELNEKESAKLLARAGFAFNPSDLRDVIVQYFIREKTYDIYVINTALYEHGEDVFGEKE